MKNIIFSTVLLVLIHFCVSYAPYLVSIKLKLSHNNPTPVYLCNGVIVHERIILTTADCMQVKVNGSMTSHFVDPAMVLIYAGIEPQVIRTIKSIDIGPGYNPGTLENDLAIITLNESLPLGHRPDIQWVMIDDQITVNQTCAATFTNPSIQPSVITHSVHVEDQTICNRYGNYTAFKRRDICSFYVLNPGIMCNATSNDLRYTIDRGTPLICKSKVVGLLSSVIAPSTNVGYNINCMQLRLYSAYYTRLQSYLNWIYQKISTESYAVTKPHVSPPFIGTIPSSTTVAPTHLKKKNDANVLESGYAFMMTSITFLLIKKLLY